MKALRFFAFILGIFLIVTTSFGNDLVNFTYFTGEDSLDFVFIFSEEPSKPELSEIDYARYIELILPGQIKDGQEISKFLGYSPVVGFKISSGKGTISLRFDMLLPQIPEFEVVANTLRVSFPRNSLKIEEFSSYTDSGNLGSRPSIVSLLAVLREYLNVNLIIDEASLGNTQANFVMLSDNIRAEDFFLQIIMNNTSIGYAFLPNRTVYIVRKDQIEEKVKQILKETSISPTEKNYFWSSYSLPISKTSTLYSNYTKKDLNSNSIFDDKLFLSFILTDFGTKYYKSDRDLSNDIIILPQASDDEEKIVIGMMLYGDGNLHEKFETFLSFIKGLSEEQSEKNQFWTSYSFTIQKNSELYNNFYVSEKNKTMETEYGTETIIEPGKFNRESFVNFMSEEFGKKYSKPSKNLYTDLIILPQAINSPYGIELRILLYGDKNYQLLFETFISYFGKIEKIDTLDVKTIKKEIDYSPLLSEEVEEFLIFYTEEAEFEKLQELGRVYGQFGLTCEMNTTNKKIIFEGPASEVERLILYLKDYISDRKNRGNEKLEVFKVEDGVGKIFSLTLARLFPKLIISVNGYNIRLTSDFPTFKWNTYDLEMLKSEDGKPDEISILGSNYEVTTAKKMADDKGILTPPLDSIIKFIPISEQLPDRIFSMLLDSNSPNSVKNIFPTIEIDFSFEPLLILKGKEKDIDMFEKYLRNFEENWASIVSNYELINIDSSILKSGLYINEIKTYISNKWPNIKLKSFDTLGFLYLESSDKNNLNDAKEFINKSLESFYSSSSKYSQLVFFSILTNEEISSIWNSIYREYGVEIIYLPTLKAYKIFGTKQFVKNMIEELKNLDVNKIIGGDSIDTEYVKINITELDSSEIIKLAAVKVPGVQIEAFDGGGYFITGTSLQIEKTKEMLNMLSTDFMDESSIMQLTTGVNFQTIESVLKLYYDTSSQLNILDLGNSRILLKGQKEITDNAKLILRSFELVEKVEGVEAPFVKTFNYSIESSEEYPVNLTPADLISVVKAYYPSLKIELFESSNMILLVGRKSDVEMAIVKMENMIDQKDPTVSERVNYSILYDRKNGSYLNASDIITLINKAHPEVSLEIVEDGIINFTGKRENVDSAILSMHDYTNPPAVTLHDDGLTFDIRSEGFSVTEVTEEISRTIKENPKIFIPTVEATTSCKLSLEGLTWDKWLVILERLYDFDVQTITGLEDPIYAIVPANTEMSTGMRKQRVLNISQGFEEVSSLISSAYGGQVYSDEINGVVIFSGVSDSQMEELKPLIKKTVKPKKLVEISALVLEEGDKDQLLQNMSLNIGASTPTISLDSSNGLSIKSSIMDFTDFSKLLTAITKNISLDFSYNNKNTDGKNNFVSNPFITTTSGKDAYIHIGNTSTYEVSISNSTETTLVTNDTGYELRITPFVRDNGTIKLTVEISVSYAADPAPQSLFSRDERIANTEIIIKNGDTFVIGGLTGETKRKSMTKVPFIGDLPFIGQFFRNETDIKEESTINIFITPKIIEIDVPEEEIFGLNID